MFELAFFSVELTLLVFTKFVIAFNGLVIFSHYFCFTLDTKVWQIAPKNGLIKSLFFKLGQKFLKAKKMSFFYKIFLVFEFI